MDKVTRARVLAIVIIALALASMFAPWARLDGVAHVDVSGSIPGMQSYTGVYEDDLDVRMFPWGVELYPLASWATKKNGYFSSKDTYTALDLKDKEEVGDIASIFDVESTDSMGTGAWLLILVLPCLLVGMAATALYMLKPALGRLALLPAFAFYLLSLVFFIVGLNQFMSPIFGDNSISFQIASITTVFGVRGVGIDYLPAIVFPIILAVLTLVPFSGKLADKLGIQRVDLLKKKE